MSLRAGATWTLPQLPWLAFPAAAAAVAGWALFRLPYYVTGKIALALQPDEDQRSTYKLLAGVLVYSGWAVLVTGTTAAAANPVWGVATLVLLPAVGMGGLLIRERWRGAWRDLRRYVLLRSRRQLLNELRQHQRELAAQLATLLEPRAEEHLP